MLARSWSLWHDTNWTDLTCRGHVSTITDLARLSNNLAKVSELKHFVNLRIFEKGVKPSREDPVNQNGGQWIIQFFSAANIDDEFIALLFDMCGETLARFEATGLELNVRNRGHRLSLWTKTFNPECGTYLTREFQKCVVSITFKKHSDIVAQGSTYSAPRLATFSGKERR
jgi:hypothetical protein